jgi:hypothetical protein
MASVAQTIKRGKAGRTENNELECAWKEREALSIHSAEGTEENHESFSQDIQYEIQILEFSNTKSEYYTIVVRYLEVCG